VACLQKVLVGMGDQWKRMSDGEGVATYPRPISADPETAIRTSTSINPCPICKMWYSYSNCHFVACGHTYHPWCLLEYAKTATTCTVPSCDVPFSTTDWLAALGIQPLINDVDCGLVPSRKGLKERGYRRKEMVKTTTQVIGNLFSLQHSFLLVRVRVFSIVPLIYFVIVNP
jgi:hypothetical protein